MKIHELKTWPDFFEDMLRGAKTFEYRKNDRGFEVGDILLLKEYDPIAQTYSGRQIGRKVTYMVKEAPGLPSEYCIMETTE